MASRSSLTAVLSRVVWCGLAVVVVTLTSVSLSRRCLFRPLARRRRRACAVGVGQVRDLPLRLVADVAHAALAAHLARLEDVDQGAAQPPRRPLRLGLPQAHVRTDGTR